MAAFVSARSKPVTATCERLARPAATSRRCSLIAWTPSISSGNEVKSVSPIRRWSHGYGEEEQKAADRTRADRTAHDRRARTAPRPAAFVAVATEEGTRPVSTPVAKDGEHSRQERQAADDGDEDHADRADRHRAEDRIVEQEQPRDRDHHREAAEEHRAAGRAAGGLDGAQLGRGRAAARSGSA